MKRNVVLVGLAIALLLAVISPIASSSPDGLERVAEDHGFLQLAKAPAYEILPDYTIPGVDGSASTIIAGIVGTLVVFAIAYGIGELVRRRHIATTH